MMGLLCVGAGGALGAMGRYGLGLVPLAPGLPLMTLLINFLGSVAIGAIVEASELAAGALPREAVLFLKVGLCGGFTTFSTFSLETLELIEGGQYAIAGARPGQRRSVRRRRARRKDAHPRAHADGVGARSASDALSTPESPHDRRGPDRSVCFATRYLLTPLR